jgi:transposase
MAEGTWVGLAVHARTVVTTLLDAGSGELRSLRTPAVPADTVEWFGQLPSPLRVANEAGPTPVQSGRSALCA